MTDTQHEAAERVSDERLQQIATKIISASINDQRYERPMGWDDARSIVSELLALRAHDAGQAGVVISATHAEIMRDDLQRAMQVLDHALDGARPEPSLFGDALAAAGQSIGMSVTRVHPEPKKVGEADEALSLGRAMESWRGSLKRPDMSEEGRVETPTAWMWQTSTGFHFTNYEPSFSPGDIERGFVWNLTPLVPARAALKGDSNGQ